MKFGLPEPEYNILFDLAVNPLKTAGAKVWIFGSRARGDQRPFSDIDLLYSFSPSKSRPPGLVFEIGAALEDSRLSYKVDLVDLEHLAESYRPSVEREKIEL